MNIILLDYEDIIRLSVEYLLKKRNVSIFTYENHNEYILKHNSQHNESSHDNVVISSNLEECKKYGYVYIKKPFTAEELFNLIKKLTNINFENVL